MSCKILLDQNINIKVQPWLQSEKPEWEVLHTEDLGLSLTKDEEIYAWAVENHAIIITFDDDFTHHSFC